VVIEINPRLTTSYVGLRRLARFNLAEALLRLLVGDEPPADVWAVGPVYFDSSGEVTG
jgi:predicted ATP-grasp superfamily ATP-dependent carboligase